MLLASVGYHNCSRGLLTDCHCCRPICCFWSMQNRAANTDPVNHPVVRSQLNLISYRDIEGEIFNSKLTSLSISKHKHSLNLANSLYSLLWAWMLCLNWYGEWYFSTNFIPVWLPSCLCCLWPEGDMASDHSTTTTPPPPPPTPLAQWPSITCRVLAPAEEAHHNSHLAGLANPVRPDIF